MSAPKEPVGGDRAAVDAEGQDEWELVLAELAERGLLSGRDDHDDDAEMPMLGEASAALMEEGRREAKRVLFAAVLQQAKSHATDDWFGAWLRAVRQRSTVTVDELADVCQLDPAAWRLLEEKPVQVMTLDERQMARILMLYGHRLMDAAVQVRRGLERRAKLGVVMRRRTGERAAVGCEPAPVLRQPDTPGAEKVFARLEELLRRTRTVLAKRGREDLL